MNKRRSRIFGLRSLSIKGFTLGEVLLAVLFISIAFFAFAALQQRIIISSWKTELRSQPRETARTNVIETVAKARVGQHVQLESVPGVNTGLYYARGSVIWVDDSMKKLGGQAKEQEYQYDTMVTERRVQSW